MLKIKVDQNLCISCGTCISLCPESFKINEEGKSEPINPPQDSEEKINEAKNACPVGAIFITETE